MRLQIILSALCAVGVQSQLNFGGNSETTTTTPQPSVDTRGGLLADVIGQNPIGEGNNQAGGRQTRGDHCCCVSTSQRCPVPSNGDGSGGIDPRLNLNQTRSRRQAEALEDFEIGTRIVNNPPSEELESSCPRNTRSCCYATRSELSSVDSFCRAYPGQTNEIWRQPCNEGRYVTNGPYTGNQCGERFPRDVATEGAEAKPYEMPWTCLVLKANNDFVGSCAIVPDNRENNIASGTDRVITAAHKLKNVQGPDLLKVRIIEYDASGFQQGVESEQHREFTVSTIRVHPNYDPKRLNHDVAILFLEQRISLTGRNNRNVNAACLPQCSNMFSHRYNNGTGVRCWVAGWGKDSVDGNFNFIQNKVDVPLVDFNTCDNAMRRALQNAGQNARNFRLSRSEVCAGGQAEKDACDGDGGAPLVCQAKTGRWYVVGLVTWGVGCGKKGVPGVYANVHNMLDFIVSPRNSRG